MHKIWILKFYSHLQNKSHLLACIYGILKRERLWKEVDIMFDGFARASVPMLARALVSASDWEPPVAQPYLRGESKSASVYTVGPICHALSIDMNAYFGISPPAPESVSELLRLENKSLRTQRDQLRKSLKMHRITTLALLGIVALCAFALVVDILSPTLGWFRA